MEWDFTQLGVVGIVICVHLITFKGRIVRLKVVCVGEWFEKALFFMRIIPSCGSRVGDLCRVVPRN